MTKSVHNKDQFSQSATQADQIYISSPKQAHQTSDHLLEQASSQFEDGNNEQINIQEELPQIEKKNQLLYLAGQAGFIIIIASTILIAFSQVFFLNSPKKEESQLVVTPSIAPTPLPEVLNKEQISFEVLNASGKTGQAKTIAERVEKSGFKSVKIGNYSKGLLKQTQLELSSDLEKKTNLIVQELNKEINIATISYSLNTASSSARLLVGTE